MAKKIVEGLLLVLAVFGTIALGLAIVWVIVKGFRAVWPDHFGGIPSSSYCLQYKKIVSAEPLYEDNGKHEDEAYRIKFEDGSVGLLENGDAPTGEVCVKAEWMSDEEGQRRNLKQGRQS